MIRTPSQVSSRKAMDLLLRKRSMRISRSFRAVKTPSFSLVFTAFSFIVNTTWLGKSAVTISMTLGRRLLGTFLTIFFPTILLNVIGYSTNFFKAFFF